jgi:hypothetical protein
MKRVFLSTVLAFLVTGLFAQKLDKAKEKLKEGKLDEAKTEVDGFLAVEKNQKNADAWYTKAKVYNAIAAADKTKADEAHATAFDALKKYVQYDDKMLISLQIDKYQPLNEIYGAYFKQGADNFNDKKYQASYDAFKNALVVSKYMAEKGWLTSKIDTTSTLYAGVSAEKLEKPDEAAIYYGQLADNKIAKYGGDDLIGIYQWLARHYADKKDYVNANKYAALGLELFPKDSFWPSIEIDMAKEGGNKDSLFKKYEDIISRYPENHLFKYDYAYELYKYAYDTSLAKRPANSPALIQKALDNVNAVIKTKPDYAQAQLFAGQIIFNQGVDILAESKKIKGTKPEDTKKKSDLKADAMKKFDEAAPYFLEVDKILGKQGKLKMDDKTALKEAYDLLITIYDQKNAKDKVKEFEVKFNDVDRVH